MGRDFIYRMLAALILTVFIFTILGLAPSASAQVEDQPSEVHLTWDHDDTAHTVVITWTTKYANSGDTIWYGTTSGGRDLTQYRYSMTGSHYAYPDVSEYYHEVELTDLTPDTLYYFTCGGVNGGYNIEHRFQTAPDRSTNITFVAGGDSRTNPQMRDNISREMATFNPSFVVYSGDAVDNGSIEEEWDNWFTGMDTYWVTKKANLTIPVIPALGNHEENATLFYDQYGLPGNHQWFSLDWGPDLHLIVLDSYANPAGAERDWLESDLAGHMNTPWKVVFFHQPVFSGGEQGSTVDLQEYWVPLFDKYHVDLVINGHDHDYERTYPINFSISKNSPVSGAKRGTIYIVSGGWGAPLYEGSPQWWSAYGPRPIYHFTLISIDTQGTLNLKAIDKDGKIFDEYVIKKNPKMDRQSTSSSPLDLAVIGLTGIVVIVVLAYILKKKR